jgi:ribonuclease III
MPDLRGAINSGDTFSGAIGDHKSALQEYLQAAGAGQPQYVLTAQSGPDHQKLFRVEVRVSDGNGGVRPLAESEGTTKKQAQQQAARIAFERLLAERGPTKAEQQTLTHIEQPHQPAARRRTRAAVTGAL